MKKNPSVVTIILFLFFALITTVLFSCNNEITTYTVYFNSQEGTPIDLVRVSKGSRIAEPPEPTRENYDFDGWYTDPSFAMAWKFNQDKVTYDLTLYAKWVERRYSISFNGNGHTDGEVPSIQEEQQGQTITLPGSEILHRTGYEFVCWNTQVDGSGTDYAADYEFVVDANIIFYAKWSARQYTVTFDKQDGNGGSDSITVTYDSAMPSATAPTRTGTAFDGYFDQEEGCGSQYYSSTMASLKNWNKADASTLYAKWTNTYTVTFNSQDGSYIDALEDVREGSTIQVPTPPTRDGYAFANWYTEASFETVWSFDTPITQDTTLYAKWIKTYTVTFSSQGSILSTVEDVREGSIINTPTPPTRDGYDFGGGV
ncbi:InlB B-repeat-containing protein, partial [Sphaerochaeta sp.]|uniref:InlB B-repeat-containing protein n=1 Tax=Sphaerochaeta sp. TaxID=1972642 RepID=UPI002A35B31D